MTFTLHLNGVKLAETTFPVTLTVESEVATVTLDRPEARNAVSLEMCEGLLDVFDQINRRDDIGVVLIRGNGPVFCAGADLKERRGKDALWVARRREASFAAYDAIADCKVPVIAVVHGAIVGSGGEIAMSADFVVASSDAVFSFPETHWGTVGATQRLQRVIGKRKAKELIYTNTKLPAEQALELGLVQRIAPSDELMSVIDDYTERILAAPRHAMILAKRSIDLGSEVTLAQGIRIEMQSIAENLASNQWQDGLKKFEKEHREG